MAAVSYRDLSAWHRTLGRVRIRFPDGFSRDHVPANSPPYQDYVAPYLEGPAFSPKQTNHH
jgi:hypothetical protein